MKNILKTILVVVCYVSTTYAQQVRDWKYFYTDDKTYNDITLNVKYYKDIHNYFTPFLGTWTHQSGNNTFVVTLWKVTKEPNHDHNGNLNYYFDGIYGHYKMVQNYGTANEVVVYTSETFIKQSSTLWPYAVFANSLVTNSMAGLIYDINTEPPTSPYWPLLGSLNMKIITGSNPPTATWIVRSNEGLYGTDQNTTFVIPTNITLTKM